MTYAEEMEKFKQHLAVILADRTGIDAGDSIEELCNTIAMEYFDWKLGEVEISQNRQHLSSVTKMTFQTMRRRCECEAVTARQVV